MHKSNKSLLNLECFPIVPKAWFGKILSFDLVQFLLIKIDHYSMTFALQV